MIKLKQHISPIASACVRLVRAVISNEMPNYVIAFVTGRCNMDCNYCCDIARKIRKSDEMSPLQWAYAMKDARSLIHLTITGGEPFMRKDLGELITAIVKSSGVPHVSINTNGYFTDQIRETTEHLLSTLTNIKLTVAVSLDGPPEIHDVLRNKKGAASAAYSTINELSLLKKTFSNLKIRIQSLILPENIGFLESFISDTKSLKVDFHGIIFPRDIDEKNLSKMPLITAYKKITSKQRFKNSMESRIFNVLYKHISNAIEGDDYFLPCHAGGRLVEILPNGTVIGCEMSKIKGESIIGTIGKTENHLTDICNSNIAIQFRNKKTKRCSCTFECSQICDIIFNVRNWPLLLRR